MATNRGVTPAAPAATGGSFQNIDGTNLDPAANTTNEVAETADASRGGLFNDPATDALVQASAQTSDLFAQAIQAELNAIAAADRAEEAETGAEAAEAIAVAAQTAAAASAASASTSASDADDDRIAAETARAAAVAAQGLAEGARDAAVTARTLAEALVAAANSWVDGTQPTTDQITLLTAQGVSIGTLTDNAEYWAGQAADNADFFSEDAEYFTLTRTADSLHTTEFNIVTHTGNVFDGLHLTNATLTNLGIDRDTLLLASAGLVVIGIASTGTAGDLTNDAGIFYLSEFTDSADSSRIDIGSVLNIETLEEVVFDNAFESINVPAFSTGNGRINLSFSGDTSHIVIVDSIINGNLNAVTSNAVFDALALKLNISGFTPQFRSHIEDSFKGAYNSGETYNFGDIIYHDIGEETTISTPSLYQWVNVTPGNSEPAGNASENASWEHVFSTEDLVDEVETQLATKQNTLTFDATPTEDSINPVTSDGLFDEFATKQDNLTVTTGDSGITWNPTTSTFDFSNVTGGGPGTGGVYDEALFKLTITDDDIVTFTGVSVTSNGVEIPTAQLTAQGYTVDTDLELSVFNSNSDEIYRLEYLRPDATNSVFATFNPYGDTNLNSVADNTVPFGVNNPSIVGGLRNAEFFATTAEAPDFDGDRVVKEFDLFGDLLNGDVYEDDNRYFIFSGDDAFTWTVNDVAAGINVNYLGTIYTRQDIVSDSTDTPNNLTGTYPTTGGLALEDFEPTDQTAFRTWGTENGASFFGETASWTYTGPLDTTTNTLLNNSGIFTNTSAALVTIPAGARIDAAIDLLEFGPGDTSAEFEIHLDFYGPGGTGTPRTIAVARSGEINTTGAIDFSTTLLIDQDIGVGDEIRVYIREDGFGTGFRYQITDFRFSFTADEFIRTDPVWMQTDVISVPSVDSDQWHLLGAEEVNQYAVSVDDIVTFTGYIPRIDEVVEFTNSVSWESIDIDGDTSTHVPIRFRGTLATTALAAAQGVGGFSGSEIINGGTVTASVQYNNTNVPAGAAGFADGVELVRFNGDRSALESFSPRQFGRAVTINNDDSGISTNETPIQGTTRVVAITAYDPTFDVATADGVSTTAGISISADTIFYAFEDIAIDADIGRTDAQIIEVIDARYTDQHLRINGPAGELNLPFDTAQGISYEVVTDVGGTSQNAFLTEEPIYDPNIDEFILTTNHTVNYPDDAIIEFVNGGGAIVATGRYYYHLDVTGTIRRQLFRRYNTEITDITDAGTLLGDGTYQFAVANFTINLRNHTRKDINESVGYEHEFAGLVHADNIVTRQVQDETIGHRVDDIDVQIEEINSVLGGLAGIQETITVDVPNENRPANSVWGLADLQSNIDNTAIELEDDSIVVSQAGVYHIQMSVQAGAIATYFRNFLNGASDDHTFTTRVDLQIEDKVEALVEFAAGTFAVGTYTLGSNGTTYRATAETTDNPVVDATDWEVVQWANPTRLQRKNLNLTIPGGVAGTFAHNETQNVFGTIDFNYNWEMPDDTDGDDTITTIYRFRLIQPQTDFGSYNGQARNTNTAEERLWTVTYHQFASNDVTFLNHFVIDSIDEGGQGVITGAELPNATDGTIGELFSLTAADGANEAGVYRRISNDGDDGDWVLVGPVGEGIQIFPETFVAQFDINTGDIWQYEERLWLRVGGNVTAGNQANVDAFAPRDNASWDPLTAVPDAAGLYGLLNASTDQLDRSRVEYEGAATQVVLGDGSLTATTLIAANQVIVRNADNTAWVPGNATVNNITGGTNTFFVTLGEQTRTVRELADGNIYIAVLRFVGLHDDDGNIDYTVNIRRINRTNDVWIQEVSTGNTNQFGLDVTSDTAFAAYNALVIAGLDTYAYTPI